MRITERPIAPVSNNGADQLERYSRQVRLPQIGEPGQRALAEGRVLLIGCGALGTSIADTLTRAGVGRLTIVDRDVVERSNLQRQSLFDERDAAQGIPKAHAAARRLREVNSSIEIEPIADDFSSANIRSALALEPDLLIDATDNFETRYLLNDVAVSAGIPLIYGGVIGVTGLQMTILPRAATGDPAPPWSGHESPCLRCVFPEPPPPGASPTCDTAGVLASAVNTVAAMQSAEAIKVLVGDFASVSRNLTSIDLWRSEFRSVDVSAVGADGSCECCQRRQFPFMTGDRSSQSMALCGRASVQISPAVETGVIDLEGLAMRLSSFGEFQQNPFMLRGALRDEVGDEGGPIELSIFPNGRTIVSGTTRIERARALYARYVGA